MTGAPEIGPCSPFLIVADLTVALRHYVDGLGFACTYLAPEDDPFFAIVGRGTAQIMLKVIHESVPPLPNPARHEWARWDLFIDTPDPAALAAEFAGRGIAFKQPLGTDDAGLLGFEIADPDGYVCFFGRPA